MNTDLESELAWTRRHISRLKRALQALPDLSGMRLACSMHLDMKIIPLIEGLAEHGAQLFLVTCNPATVRDPVVDYLRRAGVRVEAYCGMPAEAVEQALDQALAWGPTHLCELGGDLTTALNRRKDPPPVQASLEGTGSGIARLQQITPRYPIYNWDDLPVKEGLHNRHMVGLSTWQTFFARTLLSLHEKKVVILGYGTVGQGVAATARAFGGAVAIVERDASRRLQAAYDGWEVLSLEDALRTADIVVTATGAREVLGGQEFSLLKDGTFLLNVGHRDDEIDITALQSFPHQAVLPFVEEFLLGQRRVYLFAGGSMANLTAGEGDSLNAFDLTLAILASGIGFLAGPGSQQPPGIYVLPRSVWEPALERP